MNKNRDAFCERFYKGDRENLKCCGNCKHWHYVNDNHVKANYCVSKIFNNNPQAICDHWIFDGITYKKRNTNKS